MEKRKFKGGPRRRFGDKRFGRKRICRFCADNIPIDYKETGILRNYVSERNKIVSSGFTGTCQKHQRLLSQAIKRARMLALLPFATSH
ncbi:MAG: 30S ribosomal protein S18 [Elusimicrobia bacterium CG1_02_37_114]|nr:MAG: 30S ribosomal protein S18 [Elusimicrobia bacterium CG1_02_37_114]PIV53839.1 MAG: 30S ribosomal protein S18 [Elusimicrobia bacterium CG02_land_8_20_14_3_00_37_13]PIZ13621.1 MAG: 30S ribosomal protein S18 [Elusimicrobia bacterium CG_4_10_14_0_8_um_filter_37_32]